jgi:PLP dependent protein
LHRLCIRFIEKQAVRFKRTIRCLLQFHIAVEDSKFGLDTEGGGELEKIIALLPQLTHVEIGGLMGMATFTDDKKQVQREFKKLKAVFDDLKSSHFKNALQFKDISMGMSDDYLLAIAEGSTMVRIGSLLFGKR